MAEADSPPSDSTIEDHRDKRTNDFSAAMLALWRRYQSGELTRSQYERALQKLVDGTSDAIVSHYADALDLDEERVREGRSKEPLARLAEVAVLAGIGGLALFDPDREDDERPSDALGQVRADQAAGSIWAMHWGVESGATGDALEDQVADFDPDLYEGDWVSAGDDRVCDSCDALEAGSPYPALDMPTLPGEGDTECLVNPDDRVLTTKGWIPIADIAIGDMVLSAFGEWRRVLEVHRHLSKSGREFAAARSPNGQWVLCTSDHRWLTDSGWQRVTDIALSAMSMYHLQYEDLQSVSSIHEVRSENHSLSSVRHYLRMWEGKRPACGSLPAVRNVNQGKRAVGAIGRQNASCCRIDQGEASATLRRINTPIVQRAQAGREILRQVLGRRQKEDDLSVSMALATSTRSHSGRDGAAPSGPQSNKRRFKQSGVAFEDRAQSSPHGGWQGYRDGSEAGSCVEAYSIDALPSVRKQVFAPASPRQSKLPILLCGVLPPGTTLFDLTIEGDHSYIVEGLLSHNCGQLCRCQVSLSYDGDDVGSVLNFDRGT